MNSDGCHAKPCEEKLIPFGMRVSQPRITPNIGRWMAVMDIADVVGEPVVHFPELPNDTTPLVGNELRREDVKWCEQREPLGTEEKWCELDMFKKQRVVLLLMYFTQYCHQSLKYLREDIGTKVFVVASTDRGATTA